MATTKVKNIKKAEWQEIAKKYKISFTDDNEVRYLVEKIAEKIGVDDKIVKLDDLKQAVYDKMNAEPVKESKPVKAGIPQKSEAKSKSKTAKTTTKKPTATKEDKKVIDKVETPSVEIDPEAELLHYRKEAQRLGVQYGVEQGTNEIKQFLDYFCQVNPPVTYVRYEETLGITLPASNVPSAPVNRLEELRKECETYGVAYGSAHTEKDLEQLLSMIRGVVPVSNTPAPKTDNFELNMDNIDAVSSSAPASIPTTSPANPITTNANTNVMQVITQKQPAPHIGMKEMNIYRDMFTQTIRNHFRLLFDHEIHEMLTRDNYPFSFEIKKNPVQQNQVEIILSLGAYSVRIPSEDRNDWLNING